MIEVFGRSIAGETTYRVGDSRRTLAAADRSDRFAMLPAVRFEQLFVVAGWAAALGCRTFG